MSKISRIAILIPLAVAALWPLAVRTQTGIQRCEGADGAVIYTDKVCTTFGAKAVPMTGELLIRVDTNGGSALPVAGYRDASEPLPSPRARARASFSGGCARTPQQLSMDLQAAFAIGDVNRVAESYHWTGMTQSQATPVMRQLERLAAQPLVEARFLDVQIGSGDLQLADLDRNTGLIQLVFADDGRHSIHADVQRYSDCYFIRF